MTEETNTTQTSVSEQASVGLDEGKRVRRTFTPKDLMPNKAWIMANVITNQGREQTVGAMILVGRLYGTVTKAENKENEVLGKVINSVMLKGVFGSESYITGEVTEGMTSAYPPMMYAELVQAAMIADPTLVAVEVDCDIGLQYTGKSIPYEWVVIAWREGKELSVLNRLRSARKRPALAGKVQQLALVVPESGVVSHTALPAADDVIEGQTVEINTASGGEATPATQDDGDKGKSSKK